MKNYQQFNHVRILRWIESLLTLDKHIQNATVVGIQTQDR